MPMKMKNMRSIDLFCASPASTAICSSTDQRFMVLDHTKPLHRLNSKLTHHYKSFTNNTYSPSSTPRKSAPCISELPFNPRPSLSTRKSSSGVSHLAYNPHSSSSRYLLGDSPFLDSLSSDSDHQNPCHPHSISTPRKSLALAPTTPMLRSDKRELRKSRSEAGRLMLMDVKMEKSKSKKKAGPPLDSPLVNPTSHDQRVLIQPKPSKQTEGNMDYGEIIRHTSVGQGRVDSPAPHKSSASVVVSSREQVVVLRVSLHCKGCEGKLRKHLSKMEGVTSFSIDLETKKVTVIGKVTPLDVLTSITKVKNAQFWPSPAASSLSSSTSTSSSMFSY